MSSAHTSELEMALRKVVDEVAGNADPPRPLDAVPENSTATLARVEVEGFIYVLTRHSPAQTEPLTDRERQVALLVKTGLGNKRIAQHLGITPATVAAYLRRIYRKLGVHSRVILAQHTSLLRQ